VPADKVEKACVELAGVVQGAAARARSSQGEDRAVAVLVADRLEAVGDPADGLRPSDRAELPRAAWPAAHKRLREAVLGVQLARGLKAPRTAAQKGTAGRIVADAHHAAALDGRQQRAAAAAVAVTGDGQANGHRSLRGVTGR